MSHFQLKRIGRNLVWSDIFTQYQGCGKWRTVQGLHVIHSQVKKDRTQLLMRCLIADTDLRNLVNVEKELTVESYVHFNLQQYYEPNEEAKTKNKTNQHSI